METLIFENVLEMAIWVHKHILNPLEQETAMLLGIRNNLRLTVYRVVPV